MAASTSITTMNSTTALHHYAGLHFPHAQRTVSEWDDFLGEPGDEVWIAPEVQDHDLLWPGWSTEEIAADVLEGGVTWSLTGAEGPGDFFLYTGTGPEVHFNTADGIDEADSFEIAPRAHVHGNWAFTEQGVYCLDFTRSATLSEGDAEVSDAFSLAVVVGEVDPRGVDPRACEGSGLPDDPDDPDATVPATPDAPSASVEGSDVSVSWTAPADGGSAITGYTVTLRSDDDRVLTRSAGGGDTQVTFGSVPAGSWTAVVTAVNAVGASSPSAASDPVTVTDDDGGDGPPPGEVVPVDDSELTEANRGDVTVPDTAEQGATITVQVGEDHAGQTVRIWLHSEPALLSTIALDAEGTARVTIPVDADLGEHKVVVQANSGALIGWDDLEIMQATGGDDSAGDRPIADRVPLPGGGGGSGGPGAGGGGLPQTGMDASAGLLMLALMLIGTGALALIARRAGIRPAL